MVMRPAAPKLVDDDRQVIAVAPKFTQQVIEPLLSGTKTAGRSSARILSSGHAEV